MQYYQEKKNNILKVLKTSKEGLTSIQAKHRLEKYGKNAIETKSRIKPLRILINQFKSFIIYILLFAVILTISLGHIVDSILILIILIINAIIGFYQELSAQKSLEALKKLSHTTAKVFRDYKLIEIDSSYLVVGDIIYLESGDRVPADCRILEANSLKVEESSLTGESLPVEKFDENYEKDLELAEQKNMLFSSSTVVNGSSRAVVVSIAKETQIGKISKMIEETEEEMTPLQKKLDSFGKKLGAAIIFICLFIFFILILTRGFSIENLIIFGLVAVSLAVAAVPTALPAVVTVVLSIGVKRLLKKKALVRKLSSVETLGSCDVICTDKTGTLTKNQMTVKRAWTINNQSKITGLGYTPRGSIENQLNPLLFEIGFHCNNSSLYREKGVWTISGDPTEAALIVSGKKNNIDEDFEKTDEIPFDSIRKMMSVKGIFKNKIYMFSKGAPDNLLDKCSYILDNNDIRKINENDLKKIYEANIKFAEESMRVLGFAYKKCKKHEDFKEEELIFVGLQAMIDPPREDVKEAISKTKLAGIRTIMITGDYLETAKAIAKEIGIEGNAIEGRQLNSLDDEELKEKLIENTNIFARVLPEHKQRIVTILQRMGHIVAMTGDGVNDAPALKKADIGVAVGSGTDVAKEVSDFVLLDDSFSTIVNAIEEGRGIYNNIQKTIMHLLSGNAAEVLIIFLAVILGFNLPLTAIMLLWINLITDGAPALAFSVDPYNKNIMKRSPIKDKSILSTENFSLIAFLSIIVSMISLYLFNLFGGYESESLILAQSMVFTFIVLSELLLIFIIREKFNTEQFKNFWLWFAIIFSIVSQILVIYTPLNEIFKLEAINFGGLIALGIGMIILYLCYEIYSLISKKLLKINYFK
jgi:Ca2+-transporting ATPase